MAKIVDITEKLNFEENPKLKVKDIQVEVSTEATTMLAVMQTIGDGNKTTPNDIIKMYNLIFDKREREKIESLKLKFTDFQILVKSAIDLVMGAGEETQGE